MSVDAATVAATTGVVAVELLPAAGWAGIVGMALVVLTQLARWTGNRFVAAAQALTPWLLGASIPLAVAALVFGRWALGLSAGVVAVAFVVLAWPLAVPPREPTTRPGATPVRVLGSNLLYVNRRTDRAVAALAAVDADVLVFVEYTDAHAKALRTSPLATRLPYRLEHSTRRRVGGTAIWSRYALEFLGYGDHGDGLVIARVQSPEPMVVFAVHPRSPIDHFGEWRRGLETVGDLDDNPNLAPGVMIDRAEPLMLVGDFNASYWHPLFRDLLRDGWRDATQVTRRGFTSSWPTDKVLVPPFVRLDHILVNDALVVLDTRDVDIPGTDHRAIIATVAAASTGRSR